MRKLYSLIPLIAIAAISIMLWPKGETAEMLPKKYKKAQRIDGAMRDRLFTSSDVDLGYIPYKKLFNAIDEGYNRLTQQSHNRSQMGGSLSDAVWRERGPNNIGGRTRSIMIDESDPNRNRIWVGGVSGGVWRTEDITKADPEWIKLGIYFESTSIGDIAQDPNNHNIIYVGTGESYTNDFPAVGIFKSTDDGATWVRLPSTTGSAFLSVNELLVDKNSNVFAATSVGGLLRSTDGGETWEKVLGTALSGANNNDFHDIIYIESNQTYYASNDNSVFKSSTGARGDWLNIGSSKPGFPTNLGRAELAVCASNPSMMYVLGEVGNSASNTYVSSDGGETWSQQLEPGGGGDFTNGQAWYDLEIAADPINCNRILAGGVGMVESTSRGLTWQGIGGGQIHVDHHFIFFDHKKPGRVLYGNDGGIWLSENSGHTITSKNQGYVTTQFYAGAIHPDQGSPYILGGTQDNNSLQITDAGLSPANSVWGGDGVFCFIDQNEPHIQIVSSQFGNYGLSTDGGLDFGFGADVNGDFINRSGYDDEANILYGQTSPNNGTFFRWKINDLATDYVKIEGIPLHISAVKVDPHVPNRVYFGGEGGRVVMVDDKLSELSVQGTVIADFPDNVSVSSIYLDKQTPDDILVSLFNYGANLENIYITNDGGNEWISIEGDLPDMPVRWAIFDPSNHDRVMIATDAGVWTTDDVNGDQTHWDPVNPDNGMPFVRVDMLVMRESDKVVLAATHGRGMMTTDVFSAAAPVIVSQPIAYEGQTVIIDGSHSVNAQSYEWDLGDNTISNERTISHTYATPGTYQITLTINGELSLVRSISVLPYLPAPYEIGTVDYTGDFETHPEHFAAYTVQGTGFQRGISSKPGKDGAHSGASAWVLGPNDNLYQNNTRAEFYTPQYDLSEQGLYELKFWTKYAVQNRNDGFQIEYSTDGGVAWHQLGTRDDPSWYNYHNTQLADGAFPIGKAYFTNAQLSWTHYAKDISFLAGEPRVSFRYVFRADNSEPGQGLVIDDFEVTKYEGSLQTTITAFNASYTGEQEITVNWTTGVEFQAKKFILERSVTGFSFSEIAQLNPTGGTTTVPQQYQWIDQSLRNVIYYRIKVINDNPELSYHHEFYTDTIVLVRDVNANIVNSVITNPFSDRILVSFSSVINEQVSLKLFDTSGRLIRDDVETPNSVATQLDGLQLPPGVYFLSIQIGEGEPTTYKLFTNGS